MPSFTDDQYRAAFDAARDALQPNIPSLSSRDRDQVASMVVDVLSRHEPSTAVEWARREWRGSMLQVSATSLNAAVNAAATAMEENPR